MRRRRPGEGHPRSPQRRVQMLNDALGLVSEISPWDHSQWRTGLMTSI